MSSAAGTETPGAAADERAPVPKGDEAKTCPTECKEAPLLRVHEAVLGGRGLRRGVPTPVTLDVKVSYTPDLKCP